MHIADNALRRATALALLLTGLLAGVAITKPADARPPVRHIHTIGSVTASPSTSVTARVRNAAPDVAWCAPNRGEREVRLALASGFGANPTPPHAEQTRRVLSRPTPAIRHTASARAQNRAPPFAFVSLD